MKSSITKKLFIITTIVLVVFISLNVLFQSVFFERFYMHRKSKMLGSNLIKVSKIYKDASSDGADYPLSEIQMFEEKNNAKVFILDGNGQMLTFPNANMDIDNSKYNAITQLNRQWKNDPSIVNNIIFSGQLYTMVMHNKNYNIDNVICAYPVNLGKMTHILIGVSSLQPVGEASSVIREFYIYFFIIAVIMSVFLSTVYSRMISKPLKKLNNHAEEVAKLNFSSRCNIDTDDEIGNLAKTFNFLTANLDKSLKELQASNQKLKEDIEKERKLEKMRREFIAGVSHELKTPIALISGYAEGLKDNIASEESRDFYLDVIMDESDKMSTLVSDMLDLSQLESGSFKLNISNFYINELCNDILKKYSESIKEKNINFEVITNDDISVEGDEFRIEQVITNFVNNAIRHTTFEGYVKLSVSDKDKYVVICVENSGDNIHKEELKNIWDKFYKIDKSRSRIEGGTGLGLSIVKNILELHNSKFGVANINGGVKFYFTLRKN